MLRRVHLCAAAVIAGWLPAQAVIVTGTGDPDVDIPAVQAAVDQGGRVVLQGHFSFDRPPGVAMAPGALGGPLATVLVSKPVTISGVAGDQGEMTSIEGGTIPFEVEAGGARISIQGLHFVHVKTAAINVFAAGRLVIASNRIEGVGPGNPGAYAGITVATVSGPPGASQLGKPENVSGTVWIVNNDIDVGGTPSENSLAIVAFAVGKSPDNEVDLYISGNNLRNVTERAIDMNTIGGRVHVERNVITSGSVAGPSSGVQPDGIHAVGAGSYLIAHNSIVSNWATGAGIRLQGNAGLSETSAIVLDNDVTMSAPEGTVFGANSAAIEIRGFAQRNVVLNNTIHGRARAALAVVSQSGGTPGNNIFVSNDFADFEPSLSGVFVDVGVANTLIIGTQGSVEDLGAGTLVFPRP